MYYITIKELVDILHELPDDTEVSSFGTGYHGYERYLSVLNMHGDTIKEIGLKRRENSAC